MAGGWGQSLRHDAQRYIKKTGTVLEACENKVCMMRLSQNLLTMTDDFKTKHALRNQLEQNTDR